jgi:hypothetical protein
MRMSVNIYQSYYKEEQKKYLDPYSTPFDNTVNLDPDKREYPQMKAVHAIEASTDPDTDYHIYGLVSWKFKEKAIIPLTKFKQFVIGNPGYDCYFINPCFILEAIVANPWEQGEWHHKGIAQIASEVMQLNELSTVLFPNHKMMFCNYFVGNTKFWNRLFAFVDNFFNVVDRSKDLKKRVYSPAGYYSDSKITNFIFLFERLVPTFLMMNNDISTLNYQYNFEEIKSKLPDQALFKQIQALSNLKSASWQLVDGSLIEIWSKRRNEFVSRYPHIIGLE